VRIGGALVAVGAVLALAAAAALLRRPPPPVPPPLPPEPAAPFEAPPASAPSPSPPSPPPELRKLREDPRLDAWYGAVLRKDAAGVLELQSALIDAEDETRAPLMEIAARDPEARMRAFSTAVLGRMRRPPPPGFFAGRLSDAEPGPRLAALAALETLGTRSELAAVEACLAPEEVRRAAERAASRIRSR
jgi:hypothetical protein